ncbi:MAG TPA: DNA-directed DNA polymerase II small subunit [Methanothermobacter sp.]|nr:DNA polymerase II small subunit [Methanothermobacter sp. MT-2]HHW05777.1 DNA-directed DNA polymerase II small subunit [Methanothermobacter sp.]HOK72308.1 DNA-directed DNA polymerase II small subunit [Methanothermobacter sp.]HOL68890.1 DNA-directed DNA polymerase II small subunit [Methanothermobacter sp.]HPQ04971.1 DNA-directed DNA polymerase II small subunit [Methanothermobacter sp.]
MSRDILLKLAEDGLLIQPEAYEKIKLLEEETIFSIIENLKNQRKDGELLIITPEKLSTDFSMSESDLKAKEPEKKFDFKIIKDTSMQSYTTGEIKDMEEYFNSRYNKLKEILLERSEFKDHIPISSASPHYDVISVIGMIRDIRDTKNNHKIIEIEDETGEINLIVHKENRKLFEEANKLVRDELIGVKGSLKGRFIIPSEIIHPSLPRIEEKPMDFSTVFISDTHIGSSTFLEESFKKFIKWLNCELGTNEHMKIAEDVKYLIIAGDIVDGIGVYPNQEKELIIKDLNEQYEEAARLIGGIRDDIKIIVAPGNHDASRIAEPQPAIPKEYAKPLYQLDNIELVSNPSIISLDGIKVLIYHGRSFDDMAMTANHLSHEKSDLIMAELLEKRHLAPIYGERTPLAYEVEDHLVIEEIPHIFHAGHVHINAYKKYKGIHLINSGTFQSQTEFQKIYNIVPTCGQVPVLHRGEIKILEFN